MQIIWPLAAAFFFGVGVVVIGNYLQDISPMILMTFNVVGLVLVLSFVFILGHSKLGFGKPIIPSGLVQWIAIMAMVIVTMLAQYCYYRSFSNVPPFIISVTVIAMPLFAFMTERLFTSLTPLQIATPSLKDWVAFIIIALGVALLVIPKEKIPFLS